MNQKIAIILKNCKTIENKQNLHDYCKNILINTIFDEIENPNDNLLHEFCINNKIDSLIFLEDGENIKHLDTAFSYSYACVTDGEWIIKPKKTFSLSKRNPTASDRPTVIKTNKKISGPKIDDAFDFLKKIYLEKNMAKFVVEVEKWFFHNSQAPNISIMLRYYASVAYFFKLKNSKQGMAQICQSLLTHPQHSEIWCLWGDVLVEAKKYHEAYHIYNTAFEAGKHRNIYDVNPVWLKKYNEYPKEMASKVKNLIDNIKVFEIKTPHQVR
jgi:hypothetical protein